MRIVKDPVGEKSPTIEAFRRIIMKADPIDRTRGKGKKGGKAGKELHINDGVYAQPPYLTQRTKSASGKGQKGIIGNRQDMFAGDDI